MFLDHIRILNSKFTHLKENNFLISCHALGSGLCQNTQPEMEGGGGIQVLHNADGGGVKFSGGKSITKV